MSYGYSARLVQLNKQASMQNWGVKLGRLCIREDIPVCMVASKLGVSRQTVYNWFCGANTPQDASLVSIKALMRVIKILK